MKLKKAPKKRRVSNSKGPGWGPIFVMAIWVLYVFCRQVYDGGKLREQMKGWGKVIEEQNVEVALEGDMVREQTKTIKLLSDYVFKLPKSPVIEFSITNWPSEIWTNPYGATISTNLSAPAEEPKMYRLGPRA